jgi:hypothetical protein
MPKLVATSGSVIRAEPGAHHYRFVALEMSPTEGAALTNIIELGNDAKSADGTPHHIIVDRCYVHGDPKAGSRRGIALNSRD